MIILVIDTADEYYMHSIAMRYDNCDVSPGYVTEVYQPANISVFVSDKDFRQLYKNAPSWDEARTAEDGLGLVIAWRVPREQSPYK